jgi:sigma-B regulation protein RsbU (phosphoserine phosphatase)
MLAPPCGALTVATTLHEKCLGASRQGVDVPRRMSADTSRLQQQLEVYKGLVEVSALINGITESAELMPAILDVARRVMKAEAASLFLVDANGDLDMVFASGIDGTHGPPATKLIVPRGRGVSGWVLEHGQPQLVRDAYEDPRFYREADKQTGFRTRSILCVPLLRHGKEIGVLQVLNSIGRASFDEADLAAFEAYGNMAATAIDKLRAIDRRHEQQRIQQELAIARDIQASFLPQRLPAHAGIGFAATYRPARHVGGDFYDVIELGPGRYFFVIGDVSGKGMPAALLMAQALSTLRLILNPRLSPATALARWNDMLCGTTIRGMFITALLGRIDAATREVELASAGHCHPLLVRAGQVTEVAVPGGPPLGILPERTMRAKSLTLGPGEWLVHYTDGLVESFNEAREPLDRAGVERLLAPAFTHEKEVVAALEAGEAAHRGAADPHDDLTLLVLGSR